MKAMSFALFVALLMVGCGEDSPSTGDPKLDKFLAEAIDWDSVQKRGDEGKELLYAPNEQTPFTGWAKMVYYNGQVKDLIQVKDGKLDGPWTHWYIYGQKSTEVINKDGNVISAATWKPNGKKCPHTNVVDGNGVVVLYDQDTGAEWVRFTYKDGEKVED
jgi:antitoxin component YwqK of YwqJK toxin-antitoxin module